MQTKELHLPPESPQDPDPVSRLTARLLEEGFRPLHEQEEEWQAIGERVYHRSEKVSFVRGETVFVLIDYPELDQRILQQAMEGQSMLFQARRKSDRALSVFQSTTVYVCIVARSESPHTASLGRYISTAGGAVVIPVVIVPEINQVVYPTVEEKVGSVRPRIEYLQYILGERREPVNMHAKTTQALYFSLAFLAILIVVVVVSVIT